MPFTYFAICPRGLEAATAEELRGLGAAVDRDTTTGGVSFTGNLSIGYAANLHSRLASRILRRVDSARYRDDDDLYKLAARTPWEQLIDARQTLRVDVTAVRATLHSLNFATLRIKDGIVDRLRARTGERPSIDTRQPGTRVFAFLDERTVTLYLDLSGEPLFKRGWRGGIDDKGAAPLKENLAAGLLVLAGWAPGMPLADPFCGSGTLVIEAAQRAAGIAPGSARSFGFEKLPDFDAALWRDLRTAAQPCTDARSPSPIAASDIDPQAVAQTQRNLQRAGLPADAVQLACGDAAALPAPWPAPGLLLANPPYGHRIDLQSDGDTRALAAPPRSAIGSAHAAGLAAFGRALKARYAGWTVCLLSGERDLPRQLGMKERRKTPVHNGPIECRLFRFEVFGERPPPLAEPATGMRDGGTGIQ